MTMPDGLEVQENRAKRGFQRYFPLLLILWILFVLYSNPSNLVFSIQRVFSPDVDPDAVEPMLEDFFSAPVAIEKMVLQKIPYHYDWEVYGMLWYFPTVEQVLERGNGLLLAWLSESYACGEEGSLPLWFIGSGGSQDYLMQKRSVQ